MKVVVGVLYALLVAQVELLLKCLSQHVLDFSVFLQQVDEDDEAEVVDKVSKVLIERRGCSFMVSF